MNDKMKFPFWNTDWTSGQPDWFQNQNQFMDAWSSFQQYMPNAGSSANPMNEAMNSWWQSAGPSLSGQQRDFYAKMMQQGKAFYFMGEQFNKLFQGINEINKQSDDWQEVFNEQFEAMKSMLGNANSDVQNAFTNSAFMNGGFDNDYFKTAEITAAIDKFLSIPGVGPDREVQAQIQEGVKLLAEYQQVSNEYNAVMNKVGVEALEAMRVRIIQMAEQDKQINSLREIYDLWVDCNESAYAQLVYTDEYSELYGRLTNALLAVKQHNGKVMDKILGKLNMPTRQGMNTVLQRVQEMKRTQSKSASRINALEDEILELRRLVGSGKKSSSNVSQPARKKVNKKAAKRTDTTTSKKQTEPKKPEQKKVSKKSTKKASKKSAKKTLNKKSSNKTIVIDI